MFEIFTHEQLAAILLRVPRSGVAWLDDMIRESRRLDPPGEVIFTPAPPSEASPSSSNEPPWIPWHGGFCPVDWDVYVEVLLGSGDLSIRKADQFPWTWRHNGDRDDIVAYRICGRSLLENEHA